VTHTRSVVGALLDPLADKALLVSVYVTLAAVGRATCRGSDRQHAHEGAPLGGRRKRGALLQAIGVSRGECPIFCVSAAAGH